MLKVEETGEVIPSVVLSPSELACALRVLSNGTVDRGDEAEIVAALVADGLISEGRPTELALGIFGGLGEGRRQVQVLSVNAHETVSVRAFLSPATTTMIVGSEDRLRVTALDPAETVQQLAASMALLTGLAGTEREVSLSEDLFSLAEDGETERIESILSLAFRDDPELTALVAGGEWAVKLLGVSDLVEGTPVLRDRVGLVTVGPVMFSMEFDPQDGACVGHSVLPVSVWAQMSSWCYSPSGQA